MVEFGRKVRYTILCKPAGGLMMDRWVLRIWPRKRPLSDEHVVAMDSGEVCVSSAVRLLPNSEKLGLGGNVTNPKGAGQADRGEVEVEVDSSGQDTVDLGHPEQPRIVHQ